MIEGVIVNNLKRIPDERGTIMHMIKVSDQIFTKFGEIYFATAYPGVVKGWHLHKKQEQNYMSSASRMNSGGASGAAFRSSYA